MLAFVIVLCIQTHHTYINKYVYCMCTEWYKGYNEHHKRGAHMHVLSETHSWFICTRKRNILKQYWIKFILLIKSPYIRKHMYYPICHHIPSVCPPIFGSLAFRSNMYNTIACKIIPTLVYNTWTKSRKNELKFKNLKSETEKKTERERWNGCC